MKKTTKRPSPKAAASQLRTEKTAILLAVKSDLRAGFNPQPDPPGD